jgi:hypothetical protein
MTSISAKWNKTGQGFERDDDTFSVGVYVTTADVHYHGDDVHVRPDVPSEMANSYQVYAVVGLDDTDSQRVSFINYAELSDAVTFAALVTRYLDERDNVIGVEEIAERETGADDDWWPEGVVDGDETSPKEALAAMLGSYAGRLDEALSN